MTREPLDKKYNVVAMSLHWIIAILVLFMLWFGRVVEDLPKGSFERLEGFQLHYSIGLTILIFTVMRIIWRVMNPGPPHPPGLKGWEKGLRDFTHYGFYGLLILIPFSGWTIASTSSLGVPIEFFGQFEWPFLPTLAEMANRKEVHEAFEGIHKYLGWGMIGFFVLHMAGILKHTFILKDGLWKRMIPGK
ncbi:MAG: cytochrome b [Sphingomonadales bacterium]